MPVNAPSFVIRSRWRVLVGLLTILALIASAGMLAAAIEADDRVDWVLVGLALVWAAIWTPFAVYSCRAGVRLSPDVLSETDFRHRHAIPRGSMVSVSVEDADSEEIPFLTYRAPVVQVLDDDPRLLSTLGGYRVGRVWIGTDAERAGRLINEWFSQLGELPRRSP